jgi:hypothetical protein
MRTAFDASGTWITRRLQASFANDSTDASAASFTARQGVPGLSAATAASLIHEKRREYTQVAAS